MATRKKYRPWSADEDAYLLANYTDQASCGHIAETLGRPPDEVFQRHLRLAPPEGLMQSERPPKLVKPPPYRGQELHGFSGRPGANDAFALPSRVNRRLFYRDGQVKEIA
jgi:hypothetical protein